MIKVSAPGGGAGKFLNFCFFFQNPVGFPHNLIYETPIDNSTRASISETIAQFINSYIKSVSTLSGIWTPEDGKIKL